MSLASEPEIPVSGVYDPELAPFDEMMLWFMAENQVPGASVAVAKDGRLVYARGFGYADHDRTIGVQPNMRFRIASVSKPITAAMILRLVEFGYFTLDDNPFDFLQIALPAGADERLKAVTIRQLLHHTAGFDADRSYDPMFQPIHIAEDQNVKGPARPIDIVRYMNKQALDFDPGARYAYSNYGYSILGRVIEKATDRSYESAVQALLFDPIGIKDTQLGRTLVPAANEVHYFDDVEAPAVIGPHIGELVPRPYGAWHLEAMDAHGGWISTASDLVRFASAFDGADQCKILTPDGIKTMVDPSGLAADDPQMYYACGWQVCVGDGGEMNTWHTGMLDGTAAILVRRYDGLTWAVLFNANGNANGEFLADLIDPLLHQAADQVQNWPAYDLFGQ